MFLHATNPEDKTSEVCLPKLSMNFQASAHLREVLLSRSLEASACIVMYIQHVLCGRSNVMQQSLQNLTKHQCLSTGRDEGGYVTDRLGSHMHLTKRRLPYQITMARC